MNKVAAGCLVLVFVFFCGTVRAAERVERPEVVTARATIEAVDQETHIVTLRDPEGDQINIAYTQAVAISVEKAAG